MATIIKSDPRAREKPCIRCGYSLRKITDSNHCPECGLSVWLSLNQNDTLEMSNPEWLRRMAWGLLVLAVASILATAAFAPASVQAFRSSQYRSRLMQVFRETDTDDPKQLMAAYRAIPRPNPDPSLVRGIQFAGAAALVIYLAGLVMATSNENRYPDRLKGMRVTARVLCAAAALALFLMFQQILFPTWRGSGYVEWMVRLVAVGTGLLTWGYLGRLARRMPHKVLLRVCGGMLLALLFSLFYSFIRNSDWLPDFIPLAYLPASAGVFAWIAVLLRRAAREADRHWGMETAGTR
jgi:cytochrome bd-type quinol oxidase subunit 2